MNSFLPMGINNIDMRKSLIVALSLFLMIGLATAQESEDFQTDVPLEYQLDGLESADFGVADDAGIGEDPTVVYRTFDPDVADNEQVLRNSMTFETITDEDYTVDIKFVNFETDSFENVISEEILQEDVQTNQLHTVEWDEREWSEDFVFDGYPAIAVDADDTVMEEFTFSDTATKEETVTYTETLFEGTLSSEWDNPPIGSLPEDFTGQNFIADGGTEGDYSLGIETDGTYILEYEFDEPVSGDELKYWKADISVEDNTEATYGFISSDVEQNEDHNIPYEVVQGLTRRYSNNEEKVRVISDGNYGFPPIETDESDWNTQRIVTGGGPGTVSLQAGNDFQTTLTWDDHTGYQWTHFSTWNAEISTDTAILFGDTTTMPNSLESVEYEKVAIVVEQIDDDGETATAYFDDFTYDSVASDLDPGDTFEPGEGDPVDNIDDRDEIVDGGIVDTVVNWISDSLGVGLTTTRILLSIFLSLGVGIAVGWSDEYGSQELATASFFLTFVSLIFVGLMPMIEGIVFLLVLLPGAWIAYKNKQPKVNT